MPPNFPARTTASMWTYRITLGLFTLLTIRYIQFARDLPDIISDGAEGPSYWLAVVSLWSAPVPLAIFTLALLLRSGASVWLFGLIVVQSLPNLVVPFLYKETSDGIQIILMAALFFVIVLPAATLVYLIQKQELRNP